MNPFQLAQIRAVADDVRDAMGDDFDDVAFLDTVDGETDLVDVADKLLEAHEEALAMAAAAKERVASLSARKSLFERRAASIKAALQSVLEATGEKKLPLTAATLHMQKGKERLELLPEFDPKQQPDALCKITREPNKAAITNALKAGTPVAGAVIVRGPETLVMRRA